MQRVSLSLFLFIFLYSNSTTAQKIDSVLNIYAEQFQQEKIYIHFDKAAYNKGETIWFKAYLMAGTDLSEYSKNFYVDVYDVSGKLLRHITSPVFRSSAKGQFDIPATYAGQSIHVRAYTQWMLNFDSSFLYNKDIVVTQLQSSKQAVVKPVTSIQFFPESGDLVNGLGTRVAFLATNQSGNPVYVSGAIRNSKNELIDSFKAEHDGMGSFSIEPNAKDTYTVYWKDEYGNSDVAGLPQIKQSGAIMQVQPQYNKATIVVKKSESSTVNMKTLFLVATMNQQVVYRSKLNLNTRGTVVAEIPTTGFPSGVMQITLFNADWQPLAERVVFVNSHEHEFYSEVRTPVKSFTKRSKNVLEVEVPDTIAANLSLSVTDAGFPVDNNNIISHLLLCADLKGYIYNPAYYFSNETDSLAQQLDLVMLTHGWRRFKWAEVVQGKLPVLAYSRDSDYLQIKGKVYGGAFTRSAAGQFINIIISGKDTSSKQKQFLTLPVNKDGTFGQPGTIFFDTLRLYYMFNGDKKLTDRTEVRFQNGALAAKWPTIKNALNQSFLSSYLSKDTSALQRARFFANEKDKFVKFSDVHSLGEVTVRTHTKSATEKLDELYASGLFSGGDGYQFDVMSDPTAQSAIDVFRYLQGRVAGLTINFSNGAPTLSWRGGTPELFLNEFNTQADVLNSLSMNDIAYIKIFRPPFFGAIGGGSGGAIAIYTRKGVDAKNASSTQGGLALTTLAGYTQYKQFYSPDYSLPQNTNEIDLRSTLYWNPYVMTDKKNRTVRIEFYNNDISKKFRIILEGVNNEGKLTRVEKIVQ